MRSNMDQMSDQSFHGSKPWTAAIVALREVIDFPPRNTKMRAPCAQMAGDTVYFNDAAYASVPGLLGPRRPSAVLGSVISVVVFSIDRMMFGRSLTHVLQKVFEALKPPLADTNATRAVDSIFCVVRVIAALFHSEPRIMLRRMASAVTESVFLFTHPLGGTFALETAAASCVFPEIGCRHRGCGSANTSALPKGIAAIRRSRRSSDDDESPILLASANVSCCHDVPRIDILGYITPVGVGSNG